MNSISATQIEETCRHEVDEATTEAKVEGVTQALVGTGRVQISGLSFGYASADHYTIKALNLDIEAGELSHFLGQVAAGNPHCSI